TTDTLRDTKLLTYARVPARLTTIPCGFFPALAPLVAGLAGSLRSMERVVSASTVLASLPSAPTLTLTSTSLPAETTYAAPGPAWLVKAIAHGLAKHRRFLPGSAARAPRGRLMNFTGLSRRVGS